MTRRICCFLALILLLHLTGCQLPEPFPPSAAPETAVPTQPSVSESTGPEPPVETEPQDRPEPEDTQLVRVTDWLHTVRESLAYATADNFTGCRIYDFAEGYLRYGTVKKLARVCEELARHGVGLILWDGFRPLEAQAKLWEICPDPNFVSHPVTGSRSHCRGNTVDVALYDLDTGKALPVPTGFDDFSAYADRDYSDCAPEAAENARLLEQIMEKHGFKSYFAEWWHFTDKDTYPVEAYFYPGMPDIWQPNCQEYISLWELPGGSLLGTIPKGAEMTLLEWDGIYARVRYGDREGYVKSHYILPEEMPALFPDTACAAEYSYDTLISHLEALAAAYPEAASLSSIGTSALGREIPVLRIGSPEAKYHILLQGAVHGREHMTAWLLAAMAEYWLAQDILSYGDVCFHIIPMVNPDGVAVSQTGTLSELQRTVYRSDRQKGYTDAEEKEYAALWKANGEGVDLNRNFPAGWEALDARAEASSQQYRGSEPFCAPEAAALRDYTLRYPLDVTVSYHAQGSLIYYEYGEDEAVNEKAYWLAQAVEAVSGYAPQGSAGLEGGGYKDWVMEELGIPSLTVEVGCGATPLAQREACSLFARNYRVLPAILRWIQSIS